MFTKRTSICLALLIVSAMVQQASSQNAPTCSLATSNPNSYALNWIKSKNVTISAEPNKNVDASICGGHWKSEGTCCDVESVKNFAKSNAEGFAQRWGKYVSRIARIKGKMLSAFKRIIKAYNSKGLTNKVNLMKNDKKVGNGFSKIYSMLPANDVEFNALKETAEKFEDKLKVYKEKGKICFDAMKVARSNLLCAVCSANAGGLTTSQSATEANIKISFADCSALVNKCFPVWQFNFELIAMTQFFALLRAPKKTGDSVKSQLASQQDVSDMDIVTAKADFATCFIKEGETTLTCNKTGSTLTVQDVSARLCTKLFTVNKANAYIEGDETVDSGIDDNDLKEADATAAEEEKGSNTVTAARVLQNAEITIGVTATETTTFSNLNADNSGLIPATSITTSNAGDSDAPKHAAIMGIISTFALLAASVLF